MICANVVHHGMQIREGLVEGEDFHGSSLLSRSNAALALS